jgi:hypothetical protein
MVFLADSVDSETFLMAADSSAAIACRADD